MLGRALGPNGCEGCLDCGRLGYLGANQRVQQRRTDVSLAAMMRHLDELKCREIEALGLGPIVNSIIWVFS